MPASHRSTVRLNFVFVLLGGTTSWGAKQAVRTEHACWRSGCWYRNWGHSSLDRQGRLSPIIDICSFSTLLPTSLDLLYLHICQLWWNRKRNHIMLSLTRSCSPCHSLGQSEKFVGPLCASLLRHHVIVLGFKCRTTFRGFRFSWRCWAANLRDWVNHHIPIVAEVLFALRSSLIDSTKSTLLTSLVTSIQVYEFNDLVLSLRWLMASSS